jgi:hypothetical protein
MSYPIKAGQNLIPLDQQQYKTDRARQFVWASFKNLVEFLAWADVYVVIHRSVTVSHNTLYFPWIIFVRMKLVFSLVC